jgi:hypothetical protein
MTAEQFFTQLPNDQHPEITYRLNDRQREWVFAFAEAYAAASANVIPITPNSTRTPRP